MCIIQQLRSHSCDDAYLPAVQPVIAESAVPVLSIHNRNCGTVRQVNSMIFKQDRVKMKADHHYCVFYVDGRYEEMIRLDG